MEALTGAAIGMIGTVAVGWINRVMDRKDSKIAHERALVTQKSEEHDTRQSQRLEEATEVAIDIYQASTAHRNAGKRVRRSVEKGDKVRITKAYEEFDSTWKELWLASDTAEFLLPSSLHPSIDVLVKAAEEAARGAKRTTEENNELKATFIQRRHEFSTAVNRYLEQIRSETMVEDSKKARL